MLIALTAYLVLHFGFGSSSMLLPFEHLEASVKHSVANEAHKKQALEIVERMKSAEKAFLEKHKKSIASLDKLLARRTTSASDIERAAAPLAAELKATRAELLHLRFQMRSVLTASEWAAVFPPPASSSSSSKKNP